MKESDVMYKIGLTMIKGVGSLTAKALVSYLGSEEAIFHERPANLAKIPGIGKVLASQICDPAVLDRAKRELEFVRKNNIDILFYTEDDYPLRLKECKDSPLLLYKRGDCDLNVQKTIGIVGTRKMTSYGRSVCESIVSDLAEKHHDLLIVSGLAYGVDICAHKKALGCGLKTAGVMGHGHNMLYPQIHKSVADKMLLQGCLLSEYNTSQPIDRNNFVARNRVIAGLCDVTIVIESAAKGGALLTADFANSYNRDVCAVPGSVGLPYSVGCNNLIKENRAALVECAADIEALMNWDMDQSNRKPFQVDLFHELSEQEQHVINLLQEHKTLHINTIAKLMKLPSKELSPILLEMEFRSLINCQPGGVYTMKN